MALPFLQKYDEALEKELREVVGSPSGPLYDMLSYQLAWRDEEGELAAPPAGVSRLHASLCLLTCEGLSGKFEPALPVAAGVELIYNQSLVHEDVQVAHPQRNRRSTVWWLWGPGQAINAGDGLHALGRLAMMGLKDQGQPLDKIIEALGVLDEACIRMCEGQHMDLVFQERLDISLDSYLEMARAKTGALMSAAAELGALVATDSSEYRDSCRQVGMDLGIARQIQDDVLDLWGSADLNQGIDNVLSKKKGFPIAYALQQGEVHQKRQLGSLYLKRVLDRSDVAQLVELLDQLQARQHAQEQVEMFRQRAMDRLDQVEMSDWAKSAFEEMGRLLVSGDL